MKQKGLAPVLIILLIATAIGGYLVYSGKINLPQKQTDQQTTETTKVDETANWKTYTSDKHGFSINYLETWVINEVENKNTGFQDSVPSFKGISFGNRQGPDFEIAVEILENPEKMSLTSFFSKWDYRCCGPNTPPSNLPNAIKDSLGLTVDGINGKVLVPPIDTVGFYVKWVLLPREDKIFRITMRTADTYSVEYRETIFNQVLSTFKFTN